MRRKLLLVGRRRYRLPLAASEQRKFDALAVHLDLRVLGSAPSGAPTEDAMFHLVPPVRPRPLDGVAFHSLLPFRVASEVRRFRPDAVLVQDASYATSVLLGRRLARSQVPVLLDVHGDWRTATRLYGSRARRILSPVVDRFAVHAVRKVDGVRTVSEFTTALVREIDVEPLASFPAFMDFEPFLGDPVPLPTRPVALFVGVLELYKGVDVLARAWPHVAERVPGAELRIVGAGPREKLVAGLGELRKNLTPEEVAAELDAARCLVLPSRREGLGRVVVEALCRGRPVVGTIGGGIEQLVRTGENGLLIREGDAQALEDALVRVLSDDELAKRLAAGARPSAQRWLATPEEYAQRLADLVEAVVADS